MPGTASTAPLIRVAASVVIRVRSPVRGALLEEGVAPFCGFVGHVRQSGRFPREYLLTDHPVIDRVERELQHPLSSRALATDDLGPVKPGRLQIIVRNDRVDHSHPVGILSAVGPAQEENFASKLLPYLPG